MAGCSHFDLTGGNGAARTLCHQHEKGKQKTDFAVLARVATRGLSHAHTEAAKDTKDREDCTLQICHCSTARLAYASRRTVGRTHESE